jgi:hypothetical protein
MGEAWGIWFLDFRESLQNDGDDGTARELLNMEWWVVASVQHVGQRSILKFGF